MRPIVLVCFALAMAACPGRVQYPECKTDGDCAEHGQVCINGFCKECRDDSNCASHPDRPVCRDAICVAKRQCAKSEDCGPGFGEIDHYRLLHPVAFTGLTMPLACENIFAPLVPRPDQPEGVDALARRAREFLEVVIAGIQRAG